MPQKIGIFGGTFDPVHCGHLRISECALNQLSLDLLLFVPNAQSPLKSSVPVASFHDRVAMLRLAIEGLAKCDVSDVEGRRGGKSYTIDTLKEFEHGYPGAIFYLILGTDALSDFQRWRDSDGISQRARLAYVSRPGSPADYAPAQSMRVEMNPVDVSSTVIRERIVRGESLTGLVPDSVAAYIATRHLYESPAKHL